MKRIISSTFALFALLLLLSCGETTTNESATTTETPEPEWVQLFNGKDLDGWRVKIRGYELDDNFANTFRVEDGYLTVGYEGYEDFDYQYGHIFYDQSFSKYKFAVEYRFIGEQAPGGEGWATRNSGVMLHGQAPETMGVDQDFPISIEGQLLGGLGTGERSTANLCTPGTHVFMADTLFTPHCINSSSKTYDGDQWVRAEFIVLADSIIHHIVEGDTVMTYTRPQVGGGSVSGLQDETVKEDGKLLTEGYISLQSESHPIQFRKVEIMELE